MMPRPRPGLPEPSDERRAGVRDVRGHSNRRRDSLRAFLYRQRIEFAGIPVGRDDSNASVRQPADPGAKGCQVHESIGVKRRDGYGHKRAQRLSEIIKITTTI